MRFMVWVQRTCCSYRGQSFERSQIVPPACRRGYGTQPRRSMMAPNGVVIRGFQREAGTNVAQPPPPPTATWKTGARPSPAPWSAFRNGAARRLQPSDGSSPEGFPPPLAQRATADAPKPSAKAGAPRRIATGLRRRMVRLPICPSSTAIPQCAGNYAAVAGSRSWPGASNSRYRHGEHGARSASARTRRRPAPRRRSASPRSCN